MNKLAFLNTFDYELYLGKASGTPENCVLRPTNYLLDVLRKHQVPAIFFIDATYLHRLKETAVKYSSARKDFDAICAQLKLIKKENHKIYLHVHPHWVDAAYNEHTNQWDLADKSHFSFSKLSDFLREEVFRDAYCTMADITGNEIEGFRAGGLYIQPFSDFQSLFVKYGIKFEFSVLRKAQSKEADGYSFDFTKHPGSFAYRFENDVLKENPDGRFAEFTINTVEISFAQRLLNRAANKLFLSKTENARFGDGLPSGNRIDFPSSSKNSVVETIAVENISRVKEHLYLREVTACEYIHLLSHPKLVSPLTLGIYDSFLRKLKMKFEIVSDLNSILQLQTV